MSFPERGVLLVALLLLLFCDTCVVTVNRIITIISSTSTRVIILALVLVLVLVLVLLPCVVST